MTRNKRFKIKQKIIVCKRSSGTKDRCYLQKRKYICQLFVCLFVSFFLISASFASKEKRLLLDLNDSKEVVVAVYLLKDKRRRWWVDVVAGGGGSLLVGPCISLSSDQIIHAYIYTCIYTCIYAYMHVCMYVCTHQLLSCFCVLFVPRSSKALFSKQIYSMSLDLIALRWIFFWLSKYQLLASSSFALCFSYSQIKYNEKKSRNRNRRRRRIGLKKLNQYRPVQFSFLRVSFFFNSKKILSFFFASKSFYFLSLFSYLCLLFIISCVFLIIIIFQGKRGG